MNFYKNGAAPYRDITSVVLLNVFEIDKKKYRVFYNNGLLIWERENSNKSKVVIEIEDVVSVCYPKRKNSASVTPSSPQQVFPITPNASASTNITPSDINEDYRCFNINYAKPVINPKVQEGGDKKKSTSCKNGNIWRIYSITMYNNDKYIIKEWHDMLTKILNGLKRPRKLLLFINPYGGKKNALNLYEKYAKPIFRMANVDVSVIISQRQNQIFDLVMQHGLEGFDGIACAGGDGTFSELFNGLIYRKMMEQSGNNNESNLDYDNIPKPTIPLGIIPAGSTDTIAYCLHGTTDIKTCIIHIVLGNKQGLDISSISNEKGILKFYASVVAYGYLGDIAFENDAYRFLGPRRYEYVGFKKIMKNKGYDAEILIQKEPSNRKDCDKKCFNSCEICRKPESADENPEEEDQFKKITGKFFMVNSANISCACDRSPSGFSPTCHLGDGYMHLILVRHGSIWQNIKLLLKMSSGKGEISEYPFVELHRTRKIYLKALNGTSLNSLNESTQPISVGLSRGCSVWNCDGEVVQETDVMIRSHRQLLTVYGSGPREEDTEEKNNCCKCFS